jgi:hypothetical protein
VLVSEVDDGAAEGFGSVDISHLITRG